MLHPKKLQSYIAVIAGILTGFTPMFLFEARHGFMGLRNFLGYLFVHKETNVSLMFVKLHAQDVWSDMILNFTRTFPPHLLLPGLTVFLLLLALTLFAVINEKNPVVKKFVFFLLLLIPVNFLVFNFLRNDVYSYYLTDLSLVYMILIAYDIIWFFRNYKIIALVVSVYVFLLMANGAYISLRTSIADYGDYGGTSKLKGKMDAIDFIYKDAGGKPFGLLVFSPPVYTYAYDYLLWWYGNKKYGYLPVTEKINPFYLLIEVDNNKPWSYKGWEETVVKSGTAVFTKTLPSGFIVEKRLAE